MRIDRDHAVNLALAIFGGLLLRWSFGLHPLWWLAWIAPAPLLVAVLRSGRWASMLHALLAGLTASSADFHYFTLVAPLPMALLNVLLLALLWAVLAYPLCWCAADTLLAWWHPDGNWGSLAYSQAGFLPALQVVSLGGVAALVFVLSLLPAAIALAVVRGWQAMGWSLGAAVLLALGCIGYGFARIPAAPSPQGELVGMAVIDDFIGPRTPAAQVERIWSQYERHAQHLARQGARLILLPEKIAMLSPGAAQPLRQRMAALAARTQAWLALGVGIEEDVNGAGTRTNHLWLFAPDGRQTADYLKHRLAPPERDYAVGSSFDVARISNAAYGLAICKDMHFAAEGRAYAGLDIVAMLVPAWDFGEDGEYAARQSAVRGVEGGFAMLRAAREGLLTVTDAYGRIVAETPSATWPGAALLARMPAMARIDTPYARAGDWFGWLCTTAALLLAVRTRLSLPRTPRPSAAEC
jgi:apolipoprotein N-acyltransferase